MAQQDTLIHPARKMRRVVKDTKIIEEGVESRYQCPVCGRSAWFPVNQDPMSSYFTRWVCDGVHMSPLRYAQTPAPVADTGPPSSEELIELLRQVLRSSHLNPVLRVKIVGMVRRLKEQQKNAQDTS